MNGIHEVEGSIPFGSTNNYQIVIAIRSSHITSSCALFVQLVYLAHINYSLKDKIL